MAQRKLSTDEAKYGLIDLTKTGPLTYRELRAINNGLPEESEANQKLIDRPESFVFHPKVASQINYTNNPYDDFGNSTYDDPLANQYQYENYEGLRGERQPWYAKLGAGIAKGVALAGTTFLDGTVGLIAGIGTAIGEGRISGIWDNEVSNGLSEINRALEEILPNYRTREEEENPWYKNLGTMNFWADSVIKNLGFTVGAFYSGGVWTKALKGIGWLKGAMGAKVVGSTLSAVNEGRIEANNNSYDFLELQNREIDDMVERRREEILASDDTEAHKNANLMLLDESANRLREDAKERADAMGLTTLIGNTILLSLDNYAQFGKLYARGFKNARGLSSGITKAAEEMAAEEAGKNVIKQGSKYAWKDITKKQALMKGLRNGLLEGNEEMAQAFIAETAGNMQSYDSPDAYYEALTDQNAQLKTKDFLTSVTEGFVNTYGNGDRWEEFAVGAFTGLLGMPTFGKVNNSDANTYLGRGRSIGLSGGLFGEIGNANQQNREGREAVDVMNKYVDKMQNHARYFAQSQSFTDAMDGWAEADDAFEYKNAEDNDDFAAISRFAQTGKLNDLKEMVSQSFENLSDGELADIAMNTSPNIRMGEDGTVETSNDDGSPAIGGWRNTDGSLMSDTEEGRAQMREELIKKRDKILSEIDKYEKSVETVRAIGNNSLTEDQVNELAWLNWKVRMFTDRYNSIKAENEEVLTDIQNSIQAFQRGRGRGMIDEESDKGKKLIKAIENTEEFISVLRSAKTPLQLGALVEANPHLTDFLEDWAYPILEDITGIDAATFEKAMTDLRDTTRIAKATRTFNQRYKEFKEDPIKLIKNRERINKKKEKVNKASEDVNLKDKVNNSNVSDIVHGMESGDLDEGQLDGLFSDEDNEFLNNVGTEGQPQPSGRQKVEEAKKIIKTSQRMDGAIDGLDDSSIDPQALADAHTLLKNSKDVSESEQEMLDTASQAYNDPTLLYDENDPSMQGVSQEELESILGERIDAAKSVIEQAKAVLSEQNDELDGLPEGAPVVREITPEEAQGKETGHDATEHTPTENERQKAEAAQRAAQALSAGEQAKVNDLFQDLKEGMPQENVEAFDKAVSEVLKSIDMLIGAKATNQEIGKLIKNTQSYQIAKQLAPKLDDYLNVYVTSRLNPKATEPTKQEEEPKIATPVITDQEVRQQTTAQRTVDPNQGEFTGTYQYWKPTTSYLPFGRAYVKGDNTPFYKIARTLKNQDGTPAYSEPTLRRIEAVGKYLEEHGAFKLVDSGAVKVGSNVHFTIDSTLNDQAGELVILMTDDQGRVIGDVMSSTDPRFANQLGLPQLVERITAEYKEAGSPQHFTSKEVTTVDKNMVGKIPYLADHEVMHTLNEVFVDGEQQVPFKIGVAANSGKNARILASAGRTKKQGQSDLERSINPPLTAKAGQPFLLLPTSSSVNAYMTVPIMMDSYSPATQGTALGKAIHKALERVPTSDNAHAMGIINDLEELLSVQEIHINYNGDNVKVTIKPNGAEHQMTIYNGAKNAPNIVEQLELGLQGQPFQVSRKYMNEDYDGQDYNRMIGEVAKVNLPIGTTHTVSDWFTIKPINAAGQKMKTKSPRSTGNNPHAATPQYITITKKGITLNVNPATWEVTDSTGKVYTGPNTNKVKAQAFGMHMNKNMEQPYDTEWGYYDPKTDEFVEKPSRVLRTLGEQQDILSILLDWAEGRLPYRDAVSKLKGTDYVKETKGSKALGTPDRINFTSRVEEKLGEYIKSKYPFLEVKESTMKTGVSLYGGDVKLLVITDAKGNEYGSPSNFLRSLANNPNRVLKTLGEHPSTATESSTELKDKAKKAGLLGNKVREALWARLTPEQQSIIANKKGPKQKQWMDALETAFNPATNTFDEAKLKGTVDEFLGRKALYSRTDEYQEPYKLWNKERELQWLQKALPNLSTSDHLTLAEGLIRINDSSKPGFAYGKFQEGMITISDIAARGTAYHEAFHAVVHTLLKESEYQRLFDAASERWNNITDPLKLEETLAEDFRKFMQSEEDWYDNLESKKYGTVRKTLAVLFHKLKNLINELSGKTPYINKLYYSINRGKFDRRKVGKSNITRFSKESYTSEMQTLKDKAIANGTFMKAPNGKPTNLTERQWLQVRTKNFINWFGDWINDPANASKVVDENGEPLVVYRGTRPDSTVHTTGKFRSKTLFATPNKTGAGRYGATIGLFMSIKNPAILDYGGANYDKQIEDEFHTPGLGFTALDRKAVTAVGKGYDGLIVRNVKDGTEYPIDDYITTNPNNVKSATDNVGTFNPNDPNIRYRYADKVLELEYDIRAIDQDIQSIRDQRRLAIQNKAATKWRTVNGKRYAQISTTGYLFESEALRNIPSEYRDIVTPIGIYDGTSYRYYLHLKSKEESDREVKQLKESKERLKQQLERLKDNKWDIISEEALQEQEEAHYRRIEQYYRDKMLFETLSQEDKDYLQERGITPTEYSQMTQLEQEVLFHCKY